MSPDPVIRMYRDSISDNDLKIMQALNTRVALVKKLAAYKESQGISLSDPAREDWVLSLLARANSGPLSTAELLEIFRLVLDVVRREVEAGRPR